MQWVISIIHLDSQKGNIVKKHFDIIIKWSRNMEIEAENARKG